jgi:hypothetical protein
MKNVRQTDRQSLMKKQTKTKELMKRQSKNVLKLDAFFCKYLREDLCKKTELKMEGQEK